MSAASNIQQDVYKLLLTPVKVVKGSEISYRPDIDFIVTGQTYRAAADEDMSDFSIGFYEILYRDILNGRKILDGTSLLDTDFAGDTMNSFNTIANLFKEVGTSEEKRNKVPVELWPVVLRDYKHSYHCLANFWLLPMVLGRTIEPGSKSKVGRDYMDRFLEKYRTDIDSYKNAYPEYCSQFTGFEDFSEKHFLIPAYMNETGAIDSYSQSKDGAAIIATMTEKIHQRAKAISESDNAEELWHYFKNLDLI